MMAVLKCVGSLGGAVAAQIYVAFIAPHQTDYVLFAAVAVAALCLSGVPILKLRPPPLPLNDVADCRRLRKTFWLIAAVVPGLAGIAYANSTDQLGHGGTVGCAVGIVVLWAATALSPMLAPGSRLERCLLWQTTRSETVTRLEHGATPSPRLAERPLVPDRPPWEVVRTVDCWLMLWSTFSTLGAYGITFLNLAQICEAFGRKDGVPFAVTLSMIAAACGRIFGAAFFGWCTRPTGSFIVANVIIAVAMVLLSTATAAGLYIGLLLAGIIYGGFWTTVPMIMAELFGLKHLGANYKIMCFAEAIGYLLIGRLLAAHIYEKHAPAGSTTCLGQQCFRETFLIAAELCATGALASTVLWYRTPPR